MYFYYFTLTLLLSAVFAFLQNVIMLPIFFRIVFTNSFYHGANPQDGEHGAAVSCKNRNNNECGLESIDQNCLEKDFICQFKKSKFLAFKSVSLGEDFNAESH